MLRFSPYAVAWSPAKKVAEFICRPLAEATLHKQKHADRVFLGTSDTTGSVLEGNTKLAGEGSFRAGSDWTDIQFACVLEPVSGKARSFTWSPTQRR